jgi:hypothetical protein
MPKLNTSGFTAEAVRSKVPTRQDGGRSSTSSAKVSPSKYPPAKPGALGLEPLEAAEEVADAAP